VAPKCSTVAEYNFVSFLPREPVGENIHPLMVLRVSATSSGPALTNPRVVWRTPSSSAERKLLVGSSESVAIPTLVQLCDNARHWSERAVVEESQSSVEVELRADLPPIGFVGGARELKLVETRQRFDRSSVALLRLSSRAEQTDGRHNKGRSRQNGPETGAGDDFELAIMDASFCRSAVAGQRDPLTKTFLVEVEDPLLVWCSAKG